MCLFYTGRYTEALTELSEPYEIHISFTNELNSDNTENYSRLSIIFSNHSPVTFSVF